MTWDQPRLCGDWLSAERKRGLKAVKESGCGDSERSESGRVVEVGRDAGRREEGVGLARMQVEGAGEEENTVGGAKGGGSGLSISLHPLVIINISDHTTRFKALNQGKAKRVLGVLLGKLVPALVLPFERSRAAAKGNAEHENQRRWHADAGVLSPVCVQYSGGCSVWAAGGVRFSLVLTLVAAETRPGAQILFLHRRTERSRARDCSYPGDLLPLAAWRAEAGMLSTL